MVYTSIIGTAKHESVQQERQGAKSAYCIHRLTFSCFLMKNSVHLYRREAPMISGKDIKSGSILRESLQTAFDICIGAVLGVMTGLPSGVFSFAFLLCVVAISVFLGKLSYAWLKSIKQDTRD